MNRRFAVALISALVILLSAAASWAHKKTLTVQIVNRQSSATTYSYTVPGYVNSNCNAYAYGDTASANCMATTTPARTGSYLVNGSTLSLLLPDGRIVVVNCAAKADLKPHLGDNWYRSCRQPLTAMIEVEFSGDKAKLEWAVSIDGKKKQGETYKIIGIFAKSGGTAK